MTAAYNAQPSFALEKEEIPTLIFGARSHLGHAAAVIISLGGDPAAARAWLGTILPEISFGHAKTEHAVVVAFTHTGLTKLGLADEDLQTFPTAFQSGMTSPGRPRALGDEGESDPKYWRWGGQTPCDGILVLYAKSQEALAKLHADQLGKVTAGGGTALYEIGLAPRVKDQMREPFGFVDGVSQPIIAGTPRAAGKPAKTITPAGAFVLGYEGPSGYRAISPTIPASRDPSCILPGSRDADGTAYRDLGRNGSFFVVRQLRQDVEGFNNYLTAAAETLAAQGIMPNIPRQEQTEWVAARLMGRWRNGASLVHHPEQPGRGPDNAFLFAAEDRLGLSCPIGSHIRRANPRDSLTQDPKESLLITGRHRLLRVGRPYQPQNDEKKPGIFFMCLNADIEMQFETVQQSWLNRPDFRGLRNEPDPVTSGTGSSAYTIPSPLGPGRLPSLPSFVTTIGGSYFFMPSRAALRYLAGMNTGGEKFASKEARLGGFAP